MDLAMFHRRVCDAKITSAATCKMAQTKIMAKSCETDWRKWIFILGLGLLNLYAGIFVFLYGAFALW